MHALHRLWFAYKSSKSEANIAKMEHYARAIQEVQEDMGLKTPSFPHLGIFGDVLVFRDYKTGQYGEEIDHSELKEKQELEEEKEKFEEIAPLIEEEIEKAESEGEQEEEIVTIADKIPQPLPETKYRIRHENRMHFGNRRKEEWICEECGETVPANKNHICEIKSDVIIFADNIPFRESS